MISALEDFEIGTAGQRNLNLDQNLTFGQVRDRDLLDLHVLLTVEDGGLHRALPIAFLL